MSLNEQFDSASLHSRYDGSGATLDDANDRVDLSAGSLLVAAGTILYAEWPALSIHFNLSLETNYQHLFVTLPNALGLSLPTAEVRLNRGGGAGSGQCDLRFRDTQYGGFSVAASVSDLDLTASFVLTIERNASGEWSILVNSSPVHVDIAEPQGVTDQNDEASGFEGSMQFSSASGAYLNSIVIDGVPNVPPVANDESVDVGEDTANGATVATFVATDSDGTIASYSITGTAFAIDNAGVITVLDNSGFSAGTPIVETITATDDDGDTDTATITFNITPPVFRIDSATAGPLEPGETITINHSNASASGKTYTIAGQAISEQSQDANTSVLVIPDPKTFGNQTLSYNADLVIEVTDGTDTDSVTRQIAPLSDASHKLATITALEGVYTLPEFAGFTLNDNVYAIRTSGDGGFDPATGSFESGSAGSSFLIYNQDDADSTWGTPGTLTVNLPDSVAPEITLNGPSTITLDEGDTYTEQGAVWTDNIDGTGAATVGGDVVDTNVPGTYVVDYNYVDSSNNPAATVQRVVVVNDLTAPVITLLGYNPLSWPLGTAFVDPGYSVSDNSGVDFSGDVVVSGAVDTNTEGQYVLSYDVQDAAGNAATTVTRTVNVVLIDSEAPVISLNGSTVVNHELGQPYTDPGATALDNVDGDISSDIVVTGSVDVNVAAAYTLQYNVSDAEGNAATEVTRTVIVSEAIVLDNVPFLRDVVWQGARTPEIVVGDTFRQQLTLQSNDEAYNFSAATSVKCCIVALDHSSRLSDVVDLAIDADSANGLLDIKIPSGTTSGIAQSVTRESHAKIEIQVEIAGEKYSWFGIVRLLPGYID